MAETVESTYSDAPVAAVIVLAAGGGTRMKSRTSKILHKVAGKPMLTYAVTAAQGLNPEQLVVVVGHLREQVEAHLHAEFPGVQIALQPERNGTGGAVKCGLDPLGDITGEVVVTYGDVPMLNAETLRALVHDHREGGNLATVLTARVPDPTGYGRIVREGDQIAKIVEHKDADEATRKIDEINSGIYVFDAKTLRDGLATLTPNNAQGELYVTDVIDYARSIGGRVGAHITTDLWQTEGVNDRVQLAAMNAEVNRRLCEHWMREGVTILDPSSTWIEDDVEISRDVTILPNTQLLGATHISEGASIGPDTTLSDCEVGSEAMVVRTHAELAEIGEGAHVGPYTRLRPGSIVGAEAFVGSFVEMKNATVPAGAKIEHLTYLGDSENLDALAASDNEKLDDHTASVNEKKEDK